MAAASGTLVAAGLESAGYVGQSLILSDLSTLLIALSVLVFIVVAGQTFFNLLVEGNFRQALKLIAFPLVVTFCLTTKVESGGVEWQFGGSQTDQTQLKKFVKDKIKAQVSLPFELFNRFVSGISQTAIGLILKNPVSSTVLFSARQQILDSVLNSEIISSGLRSLVVEGLQGKCAEWMDASRKVARGNRDPVYQGTSDYLNAISSYNENYTKASVRLQTNGPAYTYVVDLLTSFNSSDTARTEADGFVTSMCEGTNGVLNPDLSSNRPVVDGPVSCAQIWCWSGLGLVSEARAALDDAVNNTVGKSDAYNALAPESKAIFLQEILTDIAKKVSPDAENGLGFDNDPATLPIVIAGFLLKKQLGKDPQVSLYSEFAESSGVTDGSQSETGMNGSDRATLREQQSEYSLTTNAAHQTLSLAYSLPYVQGVILFSLALLFPFFVIACCVMKDGSGILFWAGAWVWAKSWDVGWAVVMLVDQLLWELMPHTSVYIPVSKGLNSPITVLESAFDTDPTYSLSTYYLIIGMLLLSIPTITGQIFLRGSQGLSQILLGGVQQRVSQPSAAIEQEKEATRLNYAKSISQISSLLPDPPTKNLTASSGDTPNDPAETASPAAPPTNNTPNTKAG